MIVAKNIQQVAFSLLATAHITAEHRSFSCIRQLLPLPTTTRVPTDQGKLEKVWEFEWSGKGQRKFFWKSQGI